MFITLLFSVFFSVFEFFLMLIYKPSSSLFSHKQKVRDMYV